MSSFQTIMSGGPQRFAISIPDSTATPTGTNLLSLLRTAGYLGPDSCIVTISGYQANLATSRAAFVAATGRPSAANTLATVVASDFTTHGEQIGAGEAYTVASDRDAANTALRSLAGGAAVPAIATVLF